MEPNGNIGSFVYDASNNVTTSYMGNEIKSYTYNGYGAIGKQTRFINHTDYLSGEYEYNDCGQLTKKTIGEEETVYTSNALDDLTSVTTPSGHTTSYTYDSMHRLSQVQSGGETFQYTYTGEGMIETVTYPNTDIKTTYSMIMRTV